jgi:co-chaperonin GroES (HSP10)
MTCAHNTVDKKEVLHMDIANFKPLHDDLLIERIDPDAYLSETGLILDIKDTDMDLSYFRVVKKSESVSDVNIGDVVLVSWERVTPPFRINNDQYGITSINEVVGVLDGS